MRVHGIPVHDWSYCKQISSCTVMAKSSRIAVRRHCKPMQVCVFQCRETLSIAVPSLCIAHAPLIRRIVKRNSVWRQIAIDSTGLKHHGASPHGTTQANKSVPNRWYETYRLSVSVFRIDPYVMMSRQLADKSKVGH